MPRATAMPPAWALLVALLAGMSPAGAEPGTSPYLDDQSLGNLVFGTSVDSTTLGVLAKGTESPKLPRRWVRVASEPRPGPDGRFALELRVSLPDGFMVGLPGDPDIPLQLDM